MQIRDPKQPSRGDWPKIKPLLKHLTNCRPKARQAALDWQLTALFVVGFWVLGFQFSIFHSRFSVFGCSVCLLDFAYWNSDAHTSCCCCCQWNIFSNQIEMQTCATIVWNFVGVARRELASCWMDGWMQPKIGIEKVMITENCTLLWLWMTDEFSCGCSYKNTAQTKNNKALTMKMSRTRWP